MVFKNSGSQTFKPSTFLGQSSDLSYNQMLIRMMTLFQSFSLDPSSDYFHWMSYRSCQGATEQSCSQFINIPIFQFLVHHIIHTAKESLLQTRSHRSTKKCHKPLFPINIDNCALDAGVLMEICELVPSLDHIERIG